jgi:hypothetical protein
MITHSQFRLVSVQAVIFTPDASQFTQSNVLSVVLQKYAARFNGPIQSLPLGDEAPAEIPRVVLQSADGVFRLQAGPSRVDSFWTIGKDSNESDAFKCTEVLEHFVKGSQVTLRVGRTALIINRILETSDSAQMLIDRFSNKESADSVFTNSHHFEVHNQKRYELESFGAIVNSWVRCKTAELISPVSMKGILVEQDINTLEEETLTQNYKSTTIRKFFDCARDEENSILRLYFPEEV